MTVEKLAPVLDVAKAVTRAHLSAEKKVAERVLKKVAERAFVTAVVKET